MNFRKEWHTNNFLFELFFSVTSSFNKKFPSFANFFVILDNKKFCSVQSGHFWVTK